MRKNAEILVAVKRESFTNEKTLVAFVYPKIVKKQSNG